MEDIKYNENMVADIYGNPYPLSEDLKQLRYGHKWYEVKEEETGNPYITLEDGTAVYFEISKN